MKKLLLFLFLLVPSLALAQNNNRNPCYYNANGGCDNVTVTKPLPVVVTAGAAGTQASVSLDGALAVLPPANPQFTDLFSTTLDTTTNWTVNNSGGTAATSNGSLVVSGTTTASQWGGLATKQSWAPAGSSAQVYGVAVVYNTLAITNSVRIHGVYTSPASPTLAAAITDGYVFRLDATGALFAEIYASGTAIFSANITAVSQCAPIAGIPNLYYFIFRTNLTQFGCGANPLAAIAFVNPVNQTLPVSAYSVAGLSNPASAAIMTLTGMSLSTYAASSIKSAAQYPTVNDSASVVTNSPYLYNNITTDTTTVVKSGAGVLHTICFNTPTATEVTTIFDNTAASGTKIGTWTTPASPVPACILYDVAFNTGLTILTATAVGDITVSYK